MLTVRLHGHLEERYGSEFKFHAKTVREVIDALQANFDDFTEEFIKDERAYNILVDAEAQEISGCIVPVKTDSIIDIVPIIGGAGNIFKAIGLIIVGAVLIIATGGAAAFLAAPSAAGLAAGGIAGFGAGAAASLAGVVGSTIAGALVTAVAGIGWGLVLAGVASLLAGPDGPDGNKEEGSTLNRTDNIIGQGVAIPVGYGRLMIGSVVLSASYTSSLTEVSTAYTYLNTDTGFWQDVQLNYGKNYTPGSNLEPVTDGWAAPGTPGGPPQGYTREEYTTLVEEVETAVGSSNFSIVPTLVSNGFYVPQITFNPVSASGSNIATINRIQRV
jgi:predicted phage tail protein